MFKLSNNLYVGTLESIAFTNKKDWNILYLSQKMHYAVMGWQKGQDYKNHPHYLHYSEPDRMSVNWVNGKKHLFDWSGPELFIKCLDFITAAEKNNKKCLVCCEQGNSLSPTVGLLYLSKRLNVIPAIFNEAYIEIEKLYPQYKPGGIVEYVEENWNLIN